MVMAYFLSASFLARRCRMIFENWSYQGLIINPFDEPNVFVVKIISTPFDVITHSIAFI